MAVTVYKSTDSSAPALDGQAGSLVNLLDKCLVAGYGSKTAAGWTKPYTGTNTASFRMAAGNQFYLDVNDNGPGAATTQEARLRGYETMSAVGTGTGPFPTTAQLSAGIIVRKSAAATSTTRTWTLIADDRTFYLLMQAGDTAGCWYCFCFGDFYSYIPGTDNYRTMIIGRTVENSSSITNENADKLVNNVGFGASAGHYVARSYTGTGGSLSPSKTGDGSKSGLSTVLSGTLAFPHPVDSSIWLAPVLLGESAIPAVRGKMRGFNQFLHPVASFADQDTVAGAGVYSGHTFLLFKTTGNAAAYCVDITGAWDAN